MVRILSAAVFMGVVVGALFGGTYAVYALVVVLAGLALWEFRGLSDGMGFRAPLWLLFPLGAFFAFSSTVLKNVDVADVLSVALVAGLGTFLVIVFAVIASDAAALLVGSRIGRHPFFATISPKKTVEGAVAGVVASVITMFVGVSGVLGISPVHAIVLGVLVGLSAIMGDLVESQMKRIAEVKDSSNLVPGHGGVLDRLDSILFPPILVYFYVSMFGLLTR